VLGRIHERRGNLAGAAEQYRAAVTNEPQRSDLRFTLANVYARQRRYDEAIAVLREGWSLAGRDPSWLVEVARIQVRQGKRDDAIRTMRQALAEKKNAKIADQFSIASQLASWGLHAEAVRVYEQAFAGLPKVLKDEYIGTTEFANYVRALVRAEPVASVYQKMERMRAQYLAIASNSQDTDSWKAKNIVNAIDGTMREDFGRGVVDFASSSESAALAQSVRSSVARMNTLADAENLRRYLGIARGAGLVEIEEQIQTRLKDAAFRERPKNSPTQTVQDTAYYSELRALVVFYNRHAAYGKAAEVLAAEYNRDPYKDRFDHQNQIAIQYALAGDTARELESLRAAYSSASGAITTNNSDLVERYLNILYTSGARDELDRLASSMNAHQLQLINFLIEKNEKALARKAIASSSQPEAWKASRSGEVGLFLKDTSTESENFFKKALAVASIGQMLGRKTQEGETLVGSDWFVAARNYGYWLGLTPAREADSRSFVAGEIEGNPTSASAQLELAAYYLDRKDATRADGHTLLAGELAPGNKDVTVMRGTVALARGDRKGALAQWATLMSGRVSIADAETYLKVMADNGFLRDALPSLENFLVAVVNRASRSRSDDGGIEAIKPLVREIANRARIDAKLATEVAAFFHAAILSMPNDAVIGRMLIEENLLPADQLASIYRTIHQRLADRAASVFGTSQYEDGYYAGTEYVYPARELADWRHRFVDYLIRTRSLDEARLLIATIRQEQSDYALALATRSSGEESGGSATDERYDWLPLASALIEFRSNRDATKAIAELRAYCGLDDARKSDSDVVQMDGSRIQSECLKAYALLIAEGREKEADALLYDAYRLAVRSRFTDDASLAGLAEIEARRGRADEASRLLKLLVERSTDNLRALRLAAETATRINRYSDAIEFREQIAISNPGDSTNKLELIRLIAAAGRASEAIDQVAALIAERTTPNTIRAQAAEVVGEIVRRDASQAGRTASLFEQRASQGDAGATLARAVVAEAAGNVEQARTVLAGINSGPLAAVAQLKLGVIALGAKRDAEAVAAFERAIYQDADGAISDSIAFRVPGPRAQLIALYSRTGRDLAAIRLAEGDRTSEQSLISSAVRNALTSGSSGTDAEAATISFEPSFAVARTSSASLKTIAELNDAAGLKIKTDVLASLVDAASKLGQYDRAIALERLLAYEAARPEEKTQLEKRLAEMLAAERTRQQRIATLLRVDQSNTTPSIYAARVIGK
jgi:hypothetical protein